MQATQVTVVGNIISAIDQRRLDNGTMRVSFRVANNQRRFDEWENRWVERDRFIVQVTCWRQLAEHVATSLSTGDPVVVTGRLYTREYESEGRQQTRTYLDAATVAADLMRCTVVLTRTKRRFADPVDDEVEGPGEPSGERDRDRGPREEDGSLTPLAPAGRE